VRPKKTAVQCCGEIPLGTPDITGHHRVVTVHGPGIYNFNGLRYQVETVQYTADMSLKQPEGVLLADAARLTFPFVCRRWRQGDWMVPFGMKGRKKVSDMFTDMKYTSVQKEQAVMIVDCKGDIAEQQHIAGILCRRMDDRYKITSETETIIRITIL
jgi:tRNA(Ile)-lysidine synthase